MSQLRLSPRFSSMRPAFLAACLLLWTGCSDAADQAPTGPVILEQTVEQPDLAELAAFQDLGPARAVARARTPELLAIPGVVGTAVGLNAAGRPSVKVFLAHDQVQGVPERLDNVPVSRVVTGIFVARADRTGSSRPAPIGYSIGHPDITAGTLGARVTDGTNVYILSNNHVIANSNAASLGDATLQPGSFDGGSAPADVIGTLYDYQQIRFNGPTNIMDAAIALVDPNDVSGSTPSDEGYGAPGTSVTEASLGLAVQKYGRTTGHTFGQVAEIDVTVNVCYAGFFFCTSIATFENQISISDGTFSDGGDSGSLIVTNGNGNNPVGLLFAGSETRTIGSPIGPVLQRFGVSIDPTVPGGGGNPNLPPTASFTYSCTDLDCSFDGSGSSDGDGSITNYAWDFGDGNNASGQSVNHSYVNANGSPYTVTLTVTDDDNADGQTSQQVTVSEPGGGDPNVPPTASFTYSCTDLDCSFDGSGSSDNDGTITNYAWDFGDGNNGSGQSVNHSYANANGSPYTVTLTVTDDDNADDQASQLVTVSEPGGGNAAPTVDQFDVSARVTGPWSRADVAWSVSDTDGNLAQVTIALVDSSENVLDSVTTLLSGSSASGSESVKTRSGTPDAVVIIVSDANGNITLQEVPY